MCTIVLSAKFGRIHKLKLCFKVTLPENFDRPGNHQLGKKNNIHQVRRSNYLIVVGLPIKEAPPSDVGASGNRLFLVREFVKRTKSPVNS